MAGLTYRCAPPGWTEEAPNPFTADGSYGPGWSGFRVRAEDDARGVNRQWPNGLFAFVVGRGWKRNLAADLADFLRYEARQGRQCIVSIPEVLGGTIYIDTALAKTPPWSVLRADDPRWLVHATPAANWQAIRACGELRALARLRREGMTLPGIGFAQLGEPAEYADYIMLANAGAMAPEFVVASQNAGAILTQPDTPYTPGARLFFDGHRMIADGLVVRDGLHGAKVSDHLPLEPYLLAAVTPADLDPEGTVTAWTPRTFCLGALAYFSGIVGEPVPYEHWE